MEVTHKGLKTKTKDLKEKDYKKKSEAQYYSLGIFREYKMGTLR